jgi:hypothetical protein
MATTDYTQTASPFIEAAGKNYLNELTSAIGDFKATDLSGIMGRQFIAGADPLSTQAEALAPGLAGYQPFLTQAQQLASPTAYQTYMSPYQQDVIDATMTDFDIQSAKGLPQLSNQAIQAGAFGGGREGVQRAEYQAASDRNRASLLAQLRQQGFGQAQNLAQQALTNNLNLAQQTPALLSQQIGALGALGTQRQAREQQLLTADQQLASRQALQPLEAAQQFGSGVTSLIAGYPGREVITAGAPAASPLATGLGTASTLAGIYRLINPAKSSPININYGG